MEEKKEFNRRGFLKIAGAAVTVASVPTAMTGCLNTADPASSDSPINQGTTTAGGTTTDPMVAEWSAKIAILETNGVWDPARPGALGWGR